MNEHRSTISQNVMAGITDGTVRMRPHSYYILLTTLSVGAVAMAGISITYLSSIIFFWVRIQTASTKAWGARSNMTEAVASFPWWTLALSAALSIAAVALVRHQGRLYRHKRSTIAFVLVACSLMVGLGLALMDTSDHRDSSPTNQHGQGWRQSQ